MQQTTNGTQRLLIAQAALGLSDAIVTVEALLLALPHDHKLRGSAEELGNRLQGCWARLALLEAAARILDPRAGAGSDG